MHDGRQQRILRLLRQRLFMVVLLIAVLLLIPSVWSAFGKERDSRANRKEAEVQLAQLQAQKQDLETEVARLETPAGLEDALRHRFDVGDEGEGVIYIVEQQATTGDSRTGKDGIWNWFISLWPF